MITPKDLRNLEDEAEMLGVTKLELMENAGTRSADWIKENKELEGKKVLVVCYHGNNGGDGFVLARALHDVCDVKVLFIGEKEKLSIESETNYEMLQEEEKEENEIFIDHIGDIYDANLTEYDIIIDALLGTGGDGPLKEPIRSIVQQINDSKKEVIALDIPTGLNPETGKVEDMIINASTILTFHDIKTGLKDLEEMCHVIDIGIPNT